MVSFEGVYLDDKKWNGKINEYDSNNKIVYKGKYINGKKTP